MKAHDYLNRARVLDAEIYRLQTEYITIQIQILDAISKLDDREERIILLEYYGNGKTWQEIADALGMTYNTVNTIRRSALKHMEGVLVDNDSG